MASLLTQDSLVEVSSDADGFQGVWYVAKVLETPSSVTPPGKRKTKKGSFFFVEYQTLLTEDGLKPLTEHVSSDFVRPLPPDDDLDLEVNDVVDAFHLDGWWIGVVQKVNEESKSYFVYFQNPPEVIEFKRSQLRSHWDWHGGKWVRPQKKTIKQKECATGSLKRKRGERQKLSVKVKKHDGAGVAFDKMVLKDHGIVGCELFRNTEESKAKKQDAVGLAVDKMVLKDQMSTDSESPKNAGESNGKKDDDVGGSISKMVSEDHEIIDVESATKMGESKGAKVLVNAEIVVDKMDAENCAVNDVESPKITGEFTGVSVGNPDLVGDIKEMMKQKEGGAGCLKGKRGERQKPSVRVKKHVAAGGAAGKMVLKDHPSTDAESAKNNGKSKDVTIVVNDKRHDGAEAAVHKMVLKDHGIIDAESPNMGESKGATSLVNDKEHDGAGVAVDEIDILDCAINDVESPKTAAATTDYVDASTGNVAKHSDTVCSTREADMAIVEVPSNMATIAKPISMWFAGLWPQNILVDSRFICCKTVNKWNEAEGRLVEIDREFTGNNSVTDRMPNEHSRSPLTETSSILKAIIQSLEVFQTMPQKPHFRPLKKCKEVYREGLEIAYLVTFANVVKQASRLQVNDPKTIFNSISETLLDLELHGFDVKTMQNRLAELRLMKDRQEQLQKELKEFDHQITECTREQTELTTELDEVVEKMKVLEERKRRIMSLKDKNDSKITELKLNVYIRDEDLQSVEIDFESLAASPW